MIKILHLLNTSQFSGAENVVCQIINMFKEDHNYEMFYCSLDGQIRTVLNGQEISFVPIKNMCRRELKRVINDIRPTLIHAHDRTASFMASKVCERIPLIVHMHVNNTEGFVAFVKNVIWSFSSKKYKHIFWVSKSAYDCFPFKKKLKMKSSILYNMVDSVSVLKKSQQFNTDEYDLCYVGRLVYQKNPQRLMAICLSAIKNNPKLRVAIIGSGTYSSYVEDFIKANNLNHNIDYLGFKDNPLPYIKKAKAIILTSRFEGTPMVALEAMCLGVPVVSTRVDGLSDVIIDGNNGFLCDSDEDFLDRIDKITRGTNSQMKQNCIEWASINCNINNYKSTIEKCYFDFSNKEVQQ